MRAALVHAAEDAPATRLAIVDAHEGRDDLVPIVQRHIHAEHGRHLEPIEFGEQACDGFALARELPGVGHP